MSACASIVTVGEELILGDRIDTNGPWISQTLSKLGVLTNERCTTPDNVKAIAHAICRLAAQSEVLLVTGGLGPTQDDRTRRALAVALGEELVLDQEALASIETWFSERGATMPQANDVQAMRPTSATWIANKVGTAPGLRATIGSCEVYCLPGPPSELQPMFAAVQVEMLQKLECGAPLQTTELHAWGLAESVAGKKIEDLMQLQDPTVAILMGKKGVTARVTSSDDVLAEEIASEIASRWEPFYYGCGNETLTTTVGTLLEGRGTLSTAESCTAGLLSDAMVQTSGASNWFKGGWVTYSNELKISQLGVSEELLSAEGAVSWKVASAMCDGAVAQSNTTCSLSVTGITGPNGGTKEKPVGTVFAGCSVEGKTQVREFRFTGNRNEIRFRAAHSAIQMLRWTLLGLQVETMCWQHGDLIA